MPQLSRKSFPVSIKGFESTLHVNFNPNRNDPVHTFLQGGRMWGTDLIGIAQRFWKDSSVNILDIGAHIGTFSLLASQYTYGKVIAIEASPENFVVLQRNIQDNKIKNIEPYNLAAASKVGKLRFSEAGSGAHVIEGDGYSEVVVDAVPLDQLLLPQNIKIDFVKLDIEGFEIEALAGMKKILERDRPAILFEVNGHTLNFFDKTPNDLLRAVREHKYAIFLINRPLIPVDAEAPFPFGVVDCIALPPERVLEVMGMSRAEAFSEEETKEMFQQTEDRGNDDIKNYLKVYREKLEKGVA